MCAGRIGELFLQGSGICRHRLAAVLLVQAMAPDADAGSDAGPGAPQDPQGILETMQPAAIRRWAGGAWRAALELAEAAVTVTTEDTRHCRGFRRAARIRPYPARTGFDGIVSGAGQSSKAVHAAR